MPADKKSVLVALASDPESLARVAAWCHQVSPEFPADGDSLFLCRLLLLAGLETPYSPHLPQQLVILRQCGWRLETKAREPLPGDVWVIEDASDRPVRAGVVTKRLLGFDGSTLAGVDGAAAVTGRPTRIRPGPGERFGPWLAFG
jgi:hypothetical protein